MTETSLHKIFNLLDDVSQDNAVPRNIRKNAQLISAKLKQTELAFPVRLNAAVSLLDEMSNDPNIPLHSRTQLWQVASLLEAEGKNGKAEVSNTGKKANKEKVH